MKKLTAFALLLILIPSYSYSQSGWFWQNPLTGNSTFYRVQFINNNTGYVCGNDANVMGFCLKTTDAGNFWYMTDYDFGDLFRSLSFINENTGYILGKWNHTIRKTTNGGMTWTNYGIIYYPGHYYYFDINFVNENTGFVMGDVNNYNLIRTTNGGLNWTTLNTGTFNVISKTHYIGNSTIFAVGELGEFLKSYDMGNTWNEQQIPPGYFFTSLYFADINTGYICGNGNLSPARIYKTTNNGNNWTEQNIARHPKYLQDLEFIDINSGYAVGDSSCVIRTSNGGINWNIMRYGINVQYNDISLQSFDSGFIVGNNGSFLKMTDQGSTYESIVYSVRKNLNSISAVNSTFAFVVGDSGSMMKYINNKWYTVNSGFINNFFSVCFLDSLTGLAVGSEELIIRTTNTGNSWTVVHSNGNKKLNSVHFLNELGYAAGDSGLILKTTNAGLSWYVQNSGVNLNLHKITFIDSNIAMIVGNNGLFLKTTNSGLNWITYPTGNAKNLNSVISLSSGVLYSVGDSSTLLKSTNSGMNWQQVILPTITYDLNDIVFINVNTGYIAGDQGKILKTTNSGTNWGFQASGVNNNLNELCIVNPNLGFVIGENGVIRKTIDGGGPVYTSISGSSEILQNFSLSQNYPNPFNPVTKIKFDIPANVKGQTLNVKLVVYDLLGREVTTLVNEELRPGTYEADWDASNFSSGVYFYKIISGDYIETKKMVLMK